MYDNKYKMFEYLLSFFYKLILRRPFMKFCLPKFGYKVKQKKYMRKV